MTEPDHDAAAHPVADDPVANDPVAAARARVARLLDPGSGIPAGAGPRHVERGTVDGRPVLVVADLPLAAGATVAPAATGGRRDSPPEAMAARLGIPLVRLLLPRDTTAAAQDGAMPGEAWGTLHDCLAKVPVVAVLDGAGLAAAPLPGRRQAARGALPPDPDPRPVDALRLLCSHVAIGTCADAEAPPDGLPVDAWDASDDAAFARVRRALACLPRRAGDPAPATATSTHALPTPSVPPPPTDRRQAWDASPLLATLLDAGSFVPLHADRAATPAGQLLAGLARVDGIACAVLAGDDTEHAPLWTAANAQRALRLLAIATTFRLPLVQLVDGPGIDGDAATMDAVHAIARLRAALLAPGLATCTIATRTWYADAPGADRRHGVRLRYAWPGACRFERDDAASAAALAALLGTAPDPARLRADIEAIRAPARAPLHALQAGMVDAVLAVEDTRARLREFVRLLAPSS